MSNEGDKWELSGGKTNLLPVGRCEPSPMVILTQRVWHGLQNLHSSHASELILMQVTKDSQWSQSSKEGWLIRQSTPKRTWETSILKYIYIYMSFLSLGTKSRCPNVPNDLLSPWKMQNGTYLNPNTPNGLPYPSLYSLNFTAKRTVGWKASLISPLQPQSLNLEGEKR